MNKYLIILISCLSLLTACASKEEKISEDIAEQQLYQMAQNSLDKKNYTMAIKHLQLLEARYPFGQYAEQSQLELIYAYLQNNEPEAAELSAERFIRLHPQHQQVDYAYYMKGLANYKANESFLDRYLPTDITQRDPGSSLKAFEDFRQLINLFPESPYSEDARARMRFLRARLARNEINIANYYFKREAYVAALNRGKYVIDNFPQTPAAADALAVVTQAYRLLGMNELADQSLEVLKLNFPKHPALDSNGKIDKKYRATAERSVINKATLGLFDRAVPPKFDNRAPYLKP